MSVYRNHHKTRNFTIIGNTILRNSSLTFGARGLLGFLLSQPPEYEIRGRDLARLTVNDRVRFRRRRNGEDAPVTEGRDRIFDYMTELEIAGHITRTKERAGAGRIRIVTHVHEEPVDKSLRTASGRVGFGVGAAQRLFELVSPGQTGSGLPGPGKPDAKALRTRSKDYKKGASAQTHTDGRPLHVVRTEQHLIAELEAKANPEAAS